MLTITIDADFLREHAVRIRRYLRVTVGHGSIGRQQTLRCRKVKTAADTRNLGAIGQLQLQKNSCSTHCTAALISYFFYLNTKIRNMQVS